MENTIGTLNKFINYMLVLERFIHFDMEEYDCFYEISYIVYVLEIEMVEFFKHFYLLFLCLLILYSVNDVFV